MKYLMLFVVLVFTGCNKYVKPANKENQPVLSVEKFDEIKSGIKGLGECDEGVSEFISSDKQIYITDPDFYNIYIDYSFNCKAQTKQKIIRYPNAGNKKVVTDIVEQNGKKYLKDIKTQKIVGELSYDVTYDVNATNVALDDFNNNIQHFKNRLDLIDGAIYVSRKTKLWDKHYNALVNKLVISKHNNHKWLTTHDEKLHPFTQKDFLYKFQADITKLISIGEDKTNDVVLKVSLKMIDLYPKSVYGYSNVAYIAYINKEYKKAKEYFTKALEFSPDDTVIKKNLETLEKTKKNLNIEIN